MFQTRVEVHTHLDILVGFNEASGIKMQSKSFEVRMNPAVDYKCRSQNCHSRSIFQTKLYVALRFVRSSKPTAKSIA